MAIDVGAPSPRVPGATQSGAHALLFYKVTCPTCQVAAPAMERFEIAYPGRIRGVGQDPDAALARFAGAFGMTFGSVADAPPYAFSDAYEIEHVPTLVIVDAEGTVADVVESWDRDGVNRGSARLASLLGAEPVTISEPGDGLPAFRPG